MKPTLNAGDDASLHSQLALVLNNGSPIVGYTIDAGGLMALQIRATFNVAAVPPVRSESVTAENMTALIAPYNGAAQSANAPNKPAFLRTRFN